MRKVFRLQMVPEFVEAMLKHLTDFPPDGRIVAFHVNAELYLVEAIVESEEAPLTEPGETVPLLNLHEKHRGGPA